METCSLLKLDSGTLKRINIIMQKVGPEYWGQLFAKLNGVTDGQKEVILNVTQNAWNSGRTSVTKEDFENANFLKKPEITSSKAIPDGKWIAPEEVVAINYNGDQAAINKLYTTFGIGIISSCIFDKSRDRWINPDAKVSDNNFDNMLNWGIYQFKLKLLKTIQEFVPEFTYNENYQTPSLFAETIQRALQAFNNKSKEGGIDKSSKSYLDARDAFTILRNFDKLLAQNTPFVKVKKGYENTEFANKYEYVGANIEQFTSWTTNEEVNMHDQTSPLADILLNFFNEWTYDLKTGRAVSELESTPITKNGFFQVMTAFKKYVLEELSNNPKTDLSQLEAFYYRQDPAVALNFFRTFVQNLIRIPGDSFSKTKAQGILKMLESRLHPDMKRIFWNMMFKTESNLANSGSMRDGSASNKLLKDQYKSLQLYKAKDSIWTAIKNYSDNSELRKAILEKFKITVNDESITFDFGNGLIGVVAIEGSKLNFKGVSINKHTIEYNKLTPNQKQQINEYTKNLVNAFFGGDLHCPDNYQQILNDVQNGTDYDQFGLFHCYNTPLAIVLLATDSRSFGPIEWKNQSDPKRKYVSLYPFELELQSKLTLFLAAAYGSKVNSVIKNQFGNTIATHTLTAMVYQLPKLVLEMGMRSRALKNGYKSSFDEDATKTSAIRSKFGNGNLVYQQIRTRVGMPIIRQDYNIYGKKKAARDMTGSELAYAGIMIDFFHNVISENNVSQFIEFQNTAFSDKNTHFTIPYSKDFRLDKNSAHTLISTITNIINGVNKEANIKIFEDALYNSRQYSYKAVLNNLFLDYQQVVQKSSNPLLVNLKTEFGSAQTDLQKYIAVKNAIATKINWTKEFLSANIEYVEELHSSKGKMNETLDNMIQIYVLDETKQKSQNRIAAQKRAFLRDIIDSGLEININLDKNASELIKRIGNSWLDADSGEVLLYKGDINGQFEINPLLDAYFYSDCLLSTSYNEILFGRTLFHPLKYSPNSIIDNNGVAYHDPKVIDDDYEYDPKTGRILLNEDGSLKFSDNYYAHCEANRLSTSYKRTVIAGATTHTMMPMKYGIAPEISIAVMEDLAGYGWNMMGNTEKSDAMDGAGFSSPYQSYLENLSLLDGKVGWDKKTIFGDVDPKYGCPTLLKWAVYALTNERRRLSMGSKVSAENLFKKMHSQPIGNIDLAQYYTYRTDNQPIVEYNDEGFTSMNEPIYKYDVDTEKHYLIANFTKNGTYLNWTEFETDEYGNIINRNGIPRKKEIKTIYEMDQVFGGAWCKTKDKLTGKLEYSNVNIELGAKIICAENIKDKFVGYLVNKSAIKVGARNVNSSDSWTTDTALKTTKINITHGGVQMDADHELGDSDVTEMSQMISSLIQGGYFTDEVEEIYDEIGQIVITAMKADKNLIANGDYSGIHRKLGKSLIDSFSKDAKNITGLVQGFLQKAAEDFQNGNVNVDIPFSDPLVSKTFVANLVSEINRSGIKRRYAGIASVLIPSRGMVQFYKYKHPITGKEHTCTYEDIVKRIRRDHSDLLIRNGLTAKDLITKYGAFDGTQFVFASGDAHPYIHEISSENMHECDMGETFLLVDQTGHVKVTTLDNWKDYDAVRHNSDPSIRIFKWDCAPLDLRQSDTTFMCKHKKYSIYDLNSVKANHYLNDIAEVLVDKPELTIDDLRILYPNKVRAIEAALQTILTNNDLNSIRIKQLKNRLTTITHYTLKGLDKGFVSGFEILPFFDSTHAEAYQQQFNISNLYTRFPDVMGSRINGKQLGLKPGTSIADVQELGADYWRKDLQNQYTLGVPDIPNNEYDACLIGPDGEKLYVALRSKHKFNSWATSFDFEVRNNVIYYKDEPLCQKLAKDFKQKIIKGKKVNLVVVDNLEEIRELENGSLFTSAVANYREDNKIELLKYQFKNKIDANGVLKDSISIFSRKDKAVFDPKLQKYIYPETKIRIGKKGETVEDLNVSIEDLNKTDNFRRNEELDKACKSRYQAFEKQLQYIGARIPTQSMQSFMGLQWVGFTDSPVNEVYVPFYQTWLEGSDYDIDKLYILGFGISANGKLASYSNLQKELPDNISLDFVLTLSHPDGKTYEESPNGELITHQDVIDTLSYSTNEHLNRVFKANKNNENGEVRFTDDVSSEEALLFLQMLNTHSKSKVSTSLSETALKNTVPAKILRLLRHATNQYYSANPISMAAFRKLANSSVLAFKEKKMNADNPFTKFMMQVQNMVGKDVIGITAVGMKVFFATTMAMNSRLKDLENAYTRLTTADDATRKAIQTEINDIINDITFVDPLNPNKRISLSNLNFDGVLSTIANLFGTENSDYQYIAELQRESQKIDAPEAISELLSCATDNAKELILSKINATTDFADTWTMLIATGHPLKEIYDLMSMPIFGVVSKYSKLDIFSDIISGGSPKNAVEFTLGQKHLPGADIRVLKLILGRYPKAQKDAKGNTIAPANQDNECFLNKLLYETYTEDSDTHKRGELVLRYGEPVLRANPILTDEEIDLWKSDKDFRSVLTNIIHDPNNVEKSLIISQLLLDHLHYVRVTKFKSTTNFNDDLNDIPEYEQERDPEPDYRPDDVPDENYDILENAVRNNDFTEDQQDDDSPFFKYTGEDVTKLYRYIKKYILPKNQALLELGIDLESQIDRLAEFYENVLPAVEEQKIIGLETGVNQGLKTNLPDYYGRVKSVENAVNKKLNDIEDLPSEFSKFDLIKYFKSSNDLRQQWIRQLKPVTKVYNLLGIIESVPNFRRMFELQEVASDYINHSVHSKLSLRLANELLPDNTQRLSRDEFEVVMRYVNDVLLMNWLASLQASVNIPKASPISNENYVFSGFDLKGKRIVLDGELKLNSISNYANFVKLFEEWVVPYLQNHIDDPKWSSGKAFISNISHSFKQNRTHNIKETHARLSIDTSNANGDNASLQVLGDVQRAFNSIADEKIPELGITLKDALFLYNTLVYKNGGDRHGFTALFSTAARDSKSLVSDYDRYLSTLDKEEVDLGDLREGGETNQDDNSGDYEFGVIKLNIRDLLYRMSFLDSASYKFHIKNERDEDGDVVRIFSADLFGESTDENAIDEYVVCPDANFYTMEMPFVSNIDLTPKETALTALTEKRQNANSKEAIRLITDTLINKFNLQDSIEYITTEQIDSMWKAQNAEEESDIEFNGLEDYVRCRSARAFIYNGKIYFNEDRLQSNTALHEIMHLALLAMKFNPDSEIVSKYYQLEQLVMNDLRKSENKEEYDRLVEKYGTSDKGSDFKEECLVDQLAKVFSQTWTRKTSSPLHSSDVTNFIIDSLNSMFDLDISHEIIPGKLGMTNVAQILTDFKSKFLDINPLMGTMQLNQKLKAIKRTLIERGDANELAESYIIYDC